MSGGRRGDDERSEFRRALRDAKPLARKGRRPEPPPRLTPPTPGSEGGPAAFELERSGERIEGRAPGADRRTLARLRKGEPAPERELDLHGLPAASAERALAAELEAAWQAGERCLLVIHGRGLRSEHEPVIKRSLPGWLAAPPHGARVLAFTSARPERGGAGATLVLLRRRKR
jgi:DNA-nicking Smr family endonuclease